MTAAGSYVQACSLMPGAMRTFEGWDGEMGAGQDSVPSQHCSVYLVGQFVCGWWKLHQIFTTSTEDVQRHESTSGDPSLSVLVNLH